MGKPDGPYEEYFESGKKYTEGAYEKGQMVGKFTNMLRTEASSKRETIRRD
ncbi:MAG: hypothetical protein ACKO66_08350 [Flavobacteriales bacterium]